MDPVIDYLVTHDSSALLNDRGRSDNHRSRASDPQKTDIALLWDAEKNGAAFTSFAPNSHKTAWWRCKNGHSWQQKIYAVNKGSGCPYCFGRLPVAGENDLASVHPQLAREWDTEKNGCGPETITRASARRAWWICPEGHSYQAAVFSRESGSGCPYCSGKKALEGFNDLMSTDPEVCKEWDWEKNTLTPGQVTRGSHTKVWWICERGHSYDAEPFARVAGNGCPYCAGKRVLPGFNDLATTHPRVAEQWAQDLNGRVTPQMVSKGSNRRIWWRCSEGHVWQAVVFSRTRKKASDCPVCAGTLRQRPSVQYPSRRAAEPVYVPQRPAVN